MSPILSAVHTPFSEFCKLFSVCIEQGFGSDPTLDNSCRPLHLLTCHENPKKTQEGCPKINANRDRLWVSDFATLKRSSIDVCATSTHHCIAINLSVFRVIMFSFVSNKTGDIEALVFRLLQL